MLIAVSERSLFVAGLLLSIPIIGSAQILYDGSLGLPSAQGWTYSWTNFLFFGDDTTSAGGAMLLRKVALVTAPQLVALSDRLITWTGVSNLAYTVQSSSNLATWAVEGSATSATSQFIFTNTVSASPRFFRVVYP